MVKSGSDQDATDQAFALLMAGALTDKALNRARAQAGDSRRAAGDTLSSTRPLHGNSGATRRSPSSIKAKHLSLLLPGPAPNERGGTSRFGQCEAFPEIPGG